MATYTELERHTARSDASAEPFELTSLDEFAILFEAVQSIWIFNYELDPAGLRDSLSRVLAMYPHVTGRISTHAAPGGKGKKYLVRSSNEGFPFVVGQLHGVPLSDLKFGVTVELYKYQAHLFPKVPLVANTGPLAHIQITKFPGLGVSALSFSSHHCIMDGQGHFGFVNNWAKVHRDANLLSSIPHFAYDREALEVDPEVARTTDLASVVSPAGGFAVYSYLRLAWFILRFIKNSFSMTGYIYHFSRAELDNMKRIAADGLDAAAGEYVTSTEVLIAHFWKIVLLMRGLDKARASKVSVVCNVRSRKASLTPNYFGNAILMPSTTMTVDEVVSSPLSKTTQHIRSLIRSFRGAKVDAELAWLQRRSEEGVMSYVSLDGDVQSSDLMVTHWSNFDVYGCDFGQGKPSCFAPGMPPFPGLAAICNPPPGLDGLVVCLATNGAEFATLATDRFASMIHQYRLGEK